MYYFFYLCLHELKVNLSPSPVGSQDRARVCHKAYQQEYAYELALVGLTEHIQSSPAREQVLK